jgi:hypothetical protein
MNKKLFWLFTLLFLAAGTFAEAQQTKKVPRIGAFVPASASGAPQLVEALRQGLREHGYVEEACAYFDGRVVCLNNLDER